MKSHRIMMGVAKPVARTKPHKAGRNRSVKVKIAVNRGISE